MFEIKKKKFVLKYHGMEYDLGHPADVEPILALARQTSATIGRVLHYSFSLDPEFAEKFTAQRDKVIDEKTYFRSLSKIIVDSSVISLDYEIEQDFELPNSLFALPSDLFFDEEGFHYRFYLLARDDLMQTQTPKTVTEGLAETIDAV